MAAGQGEDFAAQFAEFIKWRDAQRAAAAEQDFEVPIFEKLPDGTERSATLPFSQAKHQLASWWPDLRDALGLGEGEGDGGSGQAGGGAPGAQGSNPVARLFGGSGQQASGGRQTRQGKG